MHTIQILCRYF